MLNLYLIIIIADSGSSVGFMVEWEGRAASPSENGVQILHLLNFGAPKNGQDNVQGPPQGTRNFMLRGRWARNFWRYIKKALSTSMTETA